MKPKAHLKALKIHQIPLWEDNYIYILQEGGEAIVIDPGEFEAVQNFLTEKKLRLRLILNTHHHFDHTGGNKGLKENWGCPIYAHKKDACRIPGLEPLSHLPGKNQDLRDCLLEEEEEFSVGSFNFQVLFTPGHTSGHIVFWDQKNRLLFCGDTLFAMGCGRLFEGSPEQMFQSLSRIKKLPPETAIYSAHEYTLKNAEFALSIEPYNKDLKKRYEEVKELRKNNKATIPFLLEEELLTNPFLRAKSVSEFTQIRKLRDQF